MTLALPELIAGKTKALFDRPAVRDLYDVYRIQKGGLPVSLAADDDELHRLQRRVRIYYASLSMPFPCPIDGCALEEFASRASEFEDELYLVLNVRDRPTLEAMIEAAALILVGTCWDSPQLRRTNESQVVPMVTSIIRIRILLGAPTDQQPAWYENRWADPFLRSDAPDESLLHLGLCSHRLR